MPEIHWTTLLFGLGSGGLAGSLLTAFVTAYRRRRQPIGRRIEVTPVFDQTGDASMLDAKIAISDSQGSLTFDNLSIVDIELVNKGNVDHKSFQLGITLHTNDSCIHVESKGKDRHHTTAIAQRTTPRSPSKEIDIDLMPFNRGDLYAIQLHVVAKGKAKPNPVALSTPHPIVFVDMPTASEIAASMSASVALGPFQVTLHERK